MNAKEAKEISIWNNLPKIITDRIECAVKNGNRECTPIYSSELYVELYRHPLEELGYKVSAQTTKLDRFKFIISW